MAISWGRKTSERSGLGISNSPFLQILPAPPKIASAWYRNIVVAKQFETVMFRKKDIQQQYARIFFFDHPKSALSVGRL
jgi:hypothetical protein